MRSRRVLSVRVLVGFLLAVASLAFPPPARAAWVDSTGTKFQVGGQLRQIVPNAAGTLFPNPACSSGTSLALVQGLKLAGVDPVLYPLVLVVSCLDTNTTNAARLNFISPADGKVVKQILTSIVPSKGYPHFVLRQDKGDLLACGGNGALYSIDFSNATGTPPTAPTKQLASPPFPPTLTPSCAGLTWDAEADVIYMGLDNGSQKIGEVIAFKEGSTTRLGDFTPLPCTANGLAISGGVLLMSCVPPNPNNPSATDLTMLRLDKTTGLSLGAFGKGSLADPSNSQSPNPFHPQAGLGDLACDPVTFHKDATGRDLFTDALWSRLGANGNTVVALEFPAFTCGLPSKSVVIKNTVPYSPLAAGFSAPSGTIPGVVPRGACFESLTGLVIDSDGDGLPNCWETSGSGIDFDGDGTIDLQLCAEVPTSGDYAHPIIECADPNHKDLFVEIDYMQYHKPDPKALSQTQSVNTVGVQSVREAFAAAPVNNPDNFTGIRIHFQVDEQVTFTPVSGPLTSHVNQVVFTPCTASAGSDPTQTADFDTIKGANFGTAIERANPQALNAKRLAFRYVLFGHDLAPNASGGLGSSGCAEVGGDDAAVTLGSFSGAGTVAGHTGGVGSTDEQAGTLMHEFGHLLGLRHGGEDAINCKPNYRSVMSYNRQFSGSPIVGRRLDYSRSLDPLILLPGGQIDMVNTGLLNESVLNELVGLGVDPSLGPIPPFFNAPDQIVFGPGAWTVVSATAAPINWDRSKFTSGPNKGQPSYTTNAAANINDGSACTSLVSNEQLFGQGDWPNLLYRSSAALDFAGGRRTESPTELTKQGAEALYLARDVDGNGAGDGTDCGGTVNPDGTTSFSCKHRIDIKPSFPLPKTINPGTEANITIAIFSEINGSQVWSAATQVLLNDLATFPLTFSVESFVVSVKVNNNGGGTCSISDVPDPITGQKDTFKDLKCQFPSTMPNGTPLPTGTHFGVVSGFFHDPLTGDNRAFSARQEVTILQ